MQRGCVQQMRAPCWVAGKANPVRSSSKVPRRWITENATKREDYFGRWLSMTRFGVKIASGWEKVVEG
jgi:hypothetical protein